MDLVLDTESIMYGGRNITELVAKDLNSGASAEPNQSPVSPSGKTEADKVEKPAGTNIDKKNK
jgi:hypothetical protein